MKTTCLTTLLLLSLTLHAEEKFPIKSGNGISIPSPIDKTMTEVRDGGKTVKIPAGMVYVPAGKFKFGESETRELPAYAIARFEVTNAEFKAFADATQYRGVPRYWKNGTYPEGKANHPVLFVSLNDCQAYCDWVSSKTGWKIVVPSAEQWEKAARGPKGTLYPWGNDKDSSYRGGKLKTHFNYNAVCAAWMLEHEGKTTTTYVEKSQQAGKQGHVEDITTGNGRVFAVTADGGVDAWIDHNTNTGFVNTQIYRDLVDKGGFTTPVGSYPTGVSHYGCHDMAGNAYEWTSSIIVATNGAERGQEVNDVRGGSWYSTGRSGQSLCTGEGRKAGSGYHSVGFRIAMEFK
ncbi:formylglycine-generating enzyme family protein [Prosthecobacter vanneervenii]|uniref:Formylglycine-generating enzyme required for sulfatase activity n=1 Tax=Prosthecobacter vanneervenii TaxID=48466 RepID=A0A7W8DMH8_9BACT|nr:SUMF1/EgtB/PvdO family nonheme iron enzyme [Prosthecobacter vanneervenii]MBB5035237.1 formylglycine-generating enzyme required for sulfatase activity [Prosthecobacter vanneervenii]